MKAVLACVLVGACVAAAYRSEVWSVEEEEANGFFRKQGYVVGTAPYEEGSPIYVEDSDVPEEFTWCNKDGVNYCTASLNQHIPQYCGSCWAHGFVSSVGDRVKIARKGMGNDINLSVQHVLNCFNVGSCHGGTVIGPFQALGEMSKQGTGISYATNMPYSACSSESTEGFCSHADWTCTPINVARTCSTFTADGGKCVSLDTYPNVTLSEYGSVSGAANMQKEIFARGPISCGVDAVPMLDYAGGVVKTAGDGIDHVISVVGWGNDPQEGNYWIVRNSWGEAWGLMGYVKVGFGALSIEDDCAWGTIKGYTAIELNNEMHCFEDGSNCQGATMTSLAGNLRATA